jgi:hypothetical protein
MQMVRRCLSVGQLNSIVTSKIQFVKSNKDILIIGARLKYALLLFFALFTKMNKNVNYAYQYLSNTETYFIGRNRITPFGVQFVRSELFSYRFAIQF